MKSRIIKLSVSLLAFLLAYSGFAQKATNEGNLVGGKWIVCADTALVANYVCDKPYSGFEFFKDGRYREYPKAPIDPKKDYLQGVWTIEGSLLTIDQDDDPGLKEFPKTYSVAWQDKDHFYAKSSDGTAGPAPLIVYFQRVP